MKILHIISGDLWGGAESVVCNIIQESSRRQGIVLHVLLFNHGILEERLTSAGIDVRVINENNLPLAALFYQSYLYVRAIKPHIIHTHKHKENVLGSLISLISDIPSIRTTHGQTESDVTFFDGLKYFYKLMNIFSGRYIQKKIVAVSFDLQRKLIKQYPAKKVMTIPNGILALNKNDNLCNKPQFKNKIKVAIICRLVPVKRVDLFLAIAQILSKRESNKFDFLVFGEGPLNDTLQSLCHDYGISNNVKFMGFIKNMNQYYPEIDILVITSDHEGLPMNLLEAVVHRIPIISHDVGDINKVLCNGKCGILLKNQNPIEYSEAVIKLSSNNALADSYTRKAFENVKQHYSLKNTTDRYVDLYCSLIQ